MVLTFLPNIPQAPDFLSNSQLDLLNNNQALDGIFSKNHYAYSLGTSDQGKHKFIEMPLLAVIPTIAASEGGLYTKTAISVTPSTETDLFYTPDASTNEYQMTRTVTAKFANFGTNLAYGTPPAGFTQTGGWTFLPGGLLMQYGFYGKTGATNTVGTVQFPVTFTSAPLSVQLTLYRGSAGQDVVLDSAAPPTTTTFNFKSSSSSADGVFWMAIGK